MKRTIMVVLCIAAASLVGIWIGKRNHPPVAANPPVREATSVATTESAAPEHPPTTTTKKSRATATPAAEPTISLISPTNAAVVETVSEETKQLRQAVDQLISNQTDFHQKYITWIKLRDEGRLPQVITELEQRATNNPTSAAYPAALGQAYIHQISATKDTRQYAVLGLKADQSFDAALEIDPANWDARFFKALAMSYWPAEMNKGDDVIKRFTQLIEDQEAQTAQPHFAQSYVWLGEQYLKSGRADYADQVWRRGAVLFPSEPMIQQRLAAR